MVTGAVANVHITLINIVSFVCNVSVLITEDHFQGDVYRESVEAVS
jgi:hypothetical protein